MAERDEFEEISYTSGDPYIDEHYHEMAREMLNHICAVHPENAVITLQGGENAGKDFCTACGSVVIDETH